MPNDWISQVTVGQILTALAGIILIGVLVIAVVKLVHPIMVKLTRVADLILGRPDQQGIPGKPSMMERFDRLDDRMDGQDAEIAEIKAQVTPNHGSSAHDALARRMDGIDAKVDSILAALDDHGITPR